MLVLSRKLHESIRIGDNILIQVVEIGRGRVRLAIEAPKETLILRSEVKDARYPRKESEL